MAVTGTDELSAIHRRFDAVDRRSTPSTPAGRHDQRLDAVDIKLAAHDHRFDAVDAKLAAHDQTLSGCADPGRIPPSVRQQRPERGAIPRDPWPLRRGLPSAGPNRSDRRRLIVGADVPSERPHVPPHAPDVWAREAGGRAASWDAMARAWRAAVIERVGEGGGPSPLRSPPGGGGGAIRRAHLAAVAGDPGGVVADVRAWRTEPPLRSARPIALLPELAHLAPQAIDSVSSRSCCPTLARDPWPGALTPLDGSGVVLFTSGSTGPPKPVFPTSGASWGG